MKNLIYLLLVLISTGSCQSKSSDINQNSSIDTEDKEEILSQEETENTIEPNNTRAEEDNSKSLALPASKYFKVVDISKTQYIESSKFEMELEILNNTDFKFSKFQLFAEIHYTMKNSDYVCTSTVQYDALNPRVVENWEPHTKIKFNFVTPSWGTGGGGYFGGTMPVVSVKPCHFKRFYNYIKN